MNQYDFFLVKHYQLLGVATTLYVLVILISLDLTLAISFPSFLSWKSSHELCFVVHIFHYSIITFLL